MHHLRPGRVAQRKRRRSPSARLAFPIASSLPVLTIHSRQGRRGSHQKGSQIPDCLCLQKTSQRSFCSVATMASAADALVETLASASLAGEEEGKFIRK